MHYTPSSGRGYLAPADVPRPEFSPVLGRRVGHENRALLLTNNRGEVVSAQLLPGDTVWILPKSEPLEHWRFTDSCGEGSLSFKQGTPFLEQAYRLMICAELHGPLVLRSEESSVSPWRGGQ